jgi:hypothetical protein
MSDREAFVREMLARHTEPLTEEEREELAAFYTFQHGGLLVIGKNVRRRRGRGTTGGTDDQ